MRNRKAIIEFDWVIKAKVEKPKKKKKIWVDQFETIADGPWSARENVEHECNRKGWKLIKTIKTRKKGVAFAFWEDTSDFLTDEELAVELDTDWAALAAEIILSSEIYDRKKDEPVSPAWKASSPEAAVDGYIGLGGGTSIEHHEACMFSYSPGPKAFFSIRGDEHELVEVSGPSLMKAVRSLWAEKNGQLKLF